MKHSTSPRPIVPIDQSNNLAQLGHLLHAAADVILAISQDQPRAARDPAQLLDARQIAELVGVSVSEVRKLITANELASVRVGRLVRVTRQELERWVAARQKRPADREASSHWGMGA